jgi:spoIIIJ-associated protein
MEWVETTARTVNEAKDLALDQLGVDEVDAEFEILDEPRPGLFGRMRGEARVRARVRPTRPRPKLERRDRRRRKETGSGAAPAAAEPADTTVAAVPDTPPAARRRRGGRTERAATTTAHRSTRPDADPTTDQQEATTMDTNPTPADDDRAAAGQEAVSPEAVGAEAVRFVEGLLDAFGLDGEVELRRAGEDLEVSVDGDDLGVLIGPRGTTLLAVQDLTRVVAQRRLGDHETRLRVDIGGYRERRRAALGRFASAMADEVVASGTARVLEPMPSADRKVVHDVLSGRDDVVTRSEGEDPFRRVVISPAAR